MVDLSNLTTKINRKVLIIVAGVVVLSELTWAGWTLIKSAPKKEVVKPAITVSSDSMEKPTIISLDAPKKDLKIGERIAVSIDIESPKLTDGTDLIIFYDPKILTLVKNASNQSPIAVGNMYNDYPVNIVDEKIGRIIASGISTQKGGTLPKGAFGTIVLQAKASGKTQVSLDFTRGSTVDTNVIDNKSAGDILDRVNNLELNIVP